MSTSWTETAGEICRDALENLGVIGSGETVSAEDQVTALRALDGVLKELPLSGYHWPKLSAESALTWVAGTPQTISLPADYFNYATVWKTSAGKKVPLTQITHADWVKMLNRDQTAVEPTHFYIAPDKTLYFWPIPTADPVAYVQYQRIVGDSAAAVAPDLPQYWINPLGYGVANELSLKYGLPAQERLEINQRWQDKKKRALESSQSYEDISFTVADGVSFSGNRPNPLM